MDNNKPVEERKIIRNYINEDTLEDEFKKATNSYFGKKERKSDTPSEVSPQKNGLFTTP